MDQRDHRPLFEPQKAASHSALISGSPERKAGSFLGGRRPRSEASEKFCSARFRADPSMPSHDESLMCRRTATSAYVPFWKRLFQNRVYRNHGKMNGMAPPEVKSFNLNEWKVSHEGQCHDYVMLSQHGMPLRAERFRWDRRAFGSVPIAHNNGM